MVVVRVTHCHLTCLFFALKYWLCSLEIKQIITGIKIGNHEFKISQYADDTSLLLDGSKNHCKLVLKYKSSMLMPPAFVFIWKKHK